MYLLHSLKPGTLKYVFEHNGIKPFYSIYSQRSGVWFNALPELTNRIKAVDNIWKENIMFFNRGPVLVFKNSILNDHKFDIETRNKKDGKREKITSYESLYKKIDDFYNHPDNENIRFRGSSRWFHSHEIVTDNFIPLYRLHCVLVYREQHYKEVVCDNYKLQDSIDFMDISKNPLSFHDLYRIIHPQSCNSEESSLLNCKLDDKIEKKILTVSSASQDSYEDLRNVNKFRFSQSYFD